MKPYPLLRAGLSALTLLFVLGLSVQISAQSVATVPVGAVVMNNLPNSDICVSLSLRRPAVYSGKVSSLSGNTITPSSAVWSANQFAYSAGTQPNHYYLLFTSGAREGMYYTISSNGSNNLALDLAGDTLDTVKSLDSFEIIPFWTFGTLFPGGIGVSGTAVHSSRPTELLIPNSVSAGINLSTQFTYYYYTGTNPGWRRVGGGLAVVRNDDVLVPDSYFVYRQNDATQNNCVVTGVVPASKVMTIVGTLAANVKQDNFVALGYPIALTLEQTGLFESGAFEASATHANRTDELLLFDNKAIGKNKAAFQTYYYYSGTAPGWRRVGGGLSTVRNADIVIQPGQGFIIRKAAKANASSYLAITRLPYNLN